MARLGLIDGLKRWKLPDLHTIDYEFEKTHIDGTTKMRTDTEMVTYIPGR